MNLSASLSLTPKGVDEVTDRTYKLNIRKRSVLILLKNPQAIELILEKVVFPQEEVLEAIKELADDGFLIVSGGEVPRGVFTGPDSDSGGSYHLLNDIILSEAKFLLVDFCVDSFGTQSQGFVDELGACKNEATLQFCLRHIHAATDKLCPDRLPVLQKVIAEINATA